MNLYLFLFPDGMEKDETRNSHMFFTVHIYQVEKHSKNSKGKTHEVSRDICCDFLNDNRFSEEKFKYLRDLVGIDQPFRKMVWLFKKKRRKVACHLEIKTVRSH